MSCVQKGLWDRLDVEFVGAVDFLDAGLNRNDDNHRDGFGKWKVGVANQFR